MAFQRVLPVVCASAVNCARALLSSAHLFTAYIFYFLFHIKLKISDDVWVQYLFLWVGIISLGGFVNGCFTHVMTWTLILIRQQQKSSDAAA